MERMKEKKLYWSSSRFKNKKYISILVVLACFLCFLFGFFFRENYGSAKNVYYKTVESVVELKASDPSRGDNYGTAVFSVGNMMNYGISIAEGIVSAPGIEIEYEGMVREVIQIDINIASGSSGGALLDKNGKLIGITSFRLKDNKGDIVYGTGFAVPIDKVMEYVSSNKN